MYAIGNKRGFMDVETYRNIIIQAHKERWPGLADKLEPEYYEDAVVMIYGTESSEPQWKSYLWARDEQTRILINMPRGKEKTFDLEIPFRDCIGRILPLLDHPFMINLLVQQMLIKSATLVQLLQRMEAFAEELERIAISERREYIWMAMCAPDHLNPFA
jgi:hypothetical protein